MRAETSKKNKWHISKGKYHTARRYALLYPEWKDEYKLLDDMILVHSGDEPSGSGIGKPTEQMAIRKAGLKTKMELIEDTAEECDAVLAPWILKGVTNEYISYDYLRTVMNIPCGHNVYYDRRRKFYYLLSKKIC